jgi:hypothetical protein
MAPPGLPPWHPWEVVTQSISSCSERESRVPLAILWCPSIAAVAAKAQHDPHVAPWLLTGFTAPLVLQSTESARPSSDRITIFSSEMFSGMNPSILFFSSMVMVERKLCPTVKVFSGLALI